MIDRFVYLGSTTQVLLRLGDGTVVQSLATTGGAVDAYDVGATVTAQLPPDALRILAAP